MASQIGTGTTTGTMTAVGLTSSQLRTLRKDLNSLQFQNLKSMPLKEFHEGRVLTAYLMFDWDYSDFQTVLSFHTALIDAADRNDNFENIMVVELVHSFNKLYDDLKRRAPEAYRTIVTSDQIERLFSIVFLPDIPLSQTFQEIPANWISLLAVHIDQDFVNEIAFPTDRIREVCRAVLSVASLYSNDPSRFSDHFYESRLPIIKYLAQSLIYGVYANRLLATERQELNRRCDVWFTSSGQMVPENQISVENEIFKQGFQSKIMELRKEREEEKRKREEAKKQRRAARNDRMAEKRKKNEDNNKKKATKSAKKKEQPPKKKIFHLPVVDDDDDDDDDVTDVTDGSQTVQNSQDADGDYINPPVAADDQVVSSDASQESSLPHKCHTCPAVFSSNDQLTRHLKFHGSGQLYTCKECDFAAANPMTTERHMMIHDRPDNIKPTLLIH